MGSPRVSPLIGRWIVPTDANLGLVALQRAIRQGLAELRRGVHELTTKTDQLIGEDRIAASCERAISISAGRHS